MDKEILFLSDPARELQRIHKDDDRSWFSLGGDFDYLEQVSGGTASSPKDPGIEEPGKLEGWFFHPRMEADGADRRGQEEKRGFFHKPGGRRI